MFLTALGAASDPEKTAANIELFGGVSRVGQHLAELWARTDPARAAEWALSADPSPGSLRAALVEWLKTDPAAAQDWVLRIEPDRKRTAALAFLMDQLPATGAALAPVVNGLLQNWDSPSAAEAITSALIKWHAEPETLAHWVAAQEGSAHGERLIQSSAVAKLVEDPSKSAEALAALPSQALREAAVTEASARLLDSAEHVKA